jgi:hypothetical protein
MENSTLRVRSLDDTQHVDSEFDVLRQQPGFLTDGSLLAVSGAQSHYLISPAVNRPAWQ